MARLNELFSSITGAGREFVKHEYRKRKIRLPRSMREFCAALYSNKGEALGTALATETVKAYRKLNEPQRLDFFKLLLEEYSPDPKKIQACVASCREDLDVASLRKLIAAVEPPRQQLLRRMNMANQGTGAIVQMRCDLLGFMEEQPELEMVDDDFKHLLSSWFNPGFLTLRKIDWNTSAAVLEKLIKYEAVHEMAGWDDLHRRLEEDRRCFGFFHPALPDEPLIFVEVALVHGLANAIQPILAPYEPRNHREVDTAIFYSISNCQKGLKGISFGNFLIKRVVLELQREMPNLKRFATLSPIPGFTRWLEERLDAEPDAFIEEADLELLAKLRSQQWRSQEITKDRDKKTLLALCAYYLYNEKSGRLPRDPVARFHLGNGARIERLNWSGDTSERGMRQSLGILVNYRYDLKAVEANHEKFINNGEIEAAKAFLNLLRNQRKPQSAARPSG